jgi:hypothetical protein
VKRLDELNISLNSSSALETYIKKLRDAERDFYIEISFAAEELQGNLSTLPVVGSGGGGLLGKTKSRIRAKKVANNLRRAAEAHRHAGGMAVKTWVMFVRDFAPEIDAALGRTSGKKPGFKVAE